MSKLYKFHPLYVVMLALIMVPIGIAYSIHTSMEEQSMEEQECAKRTGTMVKTRHQGAEKWECIWIIPITSFNDRKKT